MKQSKDQKKKTEEDPKKKRSVKPEEAVAAEGGFLLNTSEILDFSEGTDSTP